MERPNYPPNPTIVWTNEAEQTVDQIRIRISDLSVLPTSTAQFIDNVVGYKSLIIIISQPYDVVIDGDGNDNNDIVKCK